MPIQQDPDDQPTGSVQRRDGDEIPPEVTPTYRGSVDAEGDWIGPYKILEKIGEGGFGVVYIAERREPMVQRVALKIIKPGMDSRAVVARFEQERQALAVMDHPNVAKVLDGGVTSSGLPFFVMELVKGEPITAFADRQRLTISQRLELFIPVCDAVQHAHMKGLIHRDIKPSNILVAPGSEGHSPIVKVIDFGVAKAISHIDSDATMFTQAGAIIGTPEYMSPEQAGGEPDIDTRTDVYSLGVLLYELLTGLLPFDSTALRRAGYAEIQRIIREVEPPKPSTRLSGALTDAGLAKAKDGEPATTTIAGNRRTRTGDLVNTLRRELEWVPIKAMRKSRDERYRSPAELADDLRRYLTGQPLIAGPESRVYRAKKFVRRNKGPVAAAAAVAFALVLGFGTALVQRNEAVFQAKRADERAEAARVAEQQATEQRAKAEASAKAEKARAEELKQVSDFQSQMLGQIDTTKAGVDLMADVRERFAASLEKAGVPKAERASRADALRAELVRVNATDAAAAMIDRTILTPAVAVIDTQFKDQPVVDAQLRQALADLYLSIGLFDAAFLLQESALATRRRVLRSEHPDTLLSINNMGNLLRSQGKLTEAEPYLREALEKSRRVLGEENRNTLMSISNMGALLQRQGKLAEAEPFYREALEKRRRVLGEQHPDTLDSISNMGALLWSQGKLAEAEPYCREALEKARRVHGEEHPQTLGTINIMCVLLQSQGKLAEAEPYCREALEKRRRVLGEEHPETLSSISNMGVLLRSQGKFAEAESYHFEDLEKSRRVLGEEHPSTIISINNLGGLLERQGKIAEAEPMFRQAVDKSKRLQGAHHPRTVAFTANLGRVLQLQGKHQAAIDLLAPIEPTARNQFTGSNARRLADFLTALGRARVGVGYDADRFTLAEANLLEAHPIYVAAKDRGPTHKDTLECVQALVDLYTAWDTAEPGKGYDAKTAEWRAKLPQTEAGTLPADKK